MKYIKLIPLFLFVASCSTFSKKVELGDKTHNLTKDYAMQRSEQISDVSYDLSFDLTQGSKSYSGTNKVTFQVQNKDHDLRIDFYKGTIKKMMVNQKVMIPNNNGAYIRIPAKALKLGKNTISMEFTHDYSKSGRGFHRFLDQQDKRSYVYTNLEPYDANQVFPCFDQPDLKATYKMLVTAPKKWKVITSVRESSIKSTKTAKVWSFPTSAKFSTYIWSLHAGDYHVWSDTKFRIPLRLFARRSLAKYVKPNDWFKHTREGFNYFDKYFATPYPYIKYDQIIVPEFFSGAMENVASVTFNERFVRKGPKSRASKRALAGVILHEMAHMWFGDLVTMKWWNDLWLNESFATYMAAKALYEATEYKEAWRSFSGRKNWAMWEDQLTTTHPIEGVVPDTLQARTNFDGISYGKGASVLKQINYLIGEKAFQKGVQHYFKKYATQNTVLSDFVGSLQTGTSEDLVEWQKSWLQTASLNTLHTNLKCDAGKISQLSFKQTYKKGYPYIRKHKVQLALVYKNKNALDIKPMDALVSGENFNVKKAVGLDCPVAIYPNHNDYGYFKIGLNQESIKNSRLVVNKLKDKYLKSLYWQTLWRMVRDGKLSVVAFSDLMQDQINKETDDLIIQFLVGNISSVLFYLPKESKEEKKFANNFIAKMEKQLWKKLLSAKAGSENQKILLGGFTSLARTSYGQGKLLALLSGKVRLKKLKMDQDRRWSIIISLSRHGYRNSERFISRELKRDKSSQGKKRAISARAGFPSLEVKKEWMNKLITSDNKSNFHEFRTIAGSLFPGDQEHLQEQFSSQFFTNLTKIEKNLNAHFARAFTGLVPFECKKEKAGRISNYLSKNESLRPGTAKGLKTTITESQRCRKIKQKARKDGYSIQI